MYPCPVPGYGGSYEHWVHIYLDVTYPEGYTFDDDYTPGPWDYAPVFGEKIAGYTAWNNYLAYEHPAQDLRIRLPSRWSDDIRVGATSGGYGTGLPDDGWQSSDAVLPGRWWARAEVCGCQPNETRLTYGAAVAEWSKTAFTSCPLPNGQEVGLSFYAVDVGGVLIPPQPTEVYPLSVEIPEG